MVFVDPQLNSSDIAKAFAAHRAAQPGRCLQWPQRQESESG